MKLKILIGILVFLIIVNVATIGTFIYVHFTQDRAQRDFFIDRFGRRHIEPPQMEHRHRMSRIPDEKRRQLRVLLNEFHAETQEMRDHIQSMESEAFKLLQMDIVDTDRVDSLLHEISELHLQISKTATKKLIEAKTYLSPDQKEIFFKSLMGAPFRLRPGKPFTGKRMNNQSDSLMRHRRERKRVESQ